MYKTYEYFHNKMAYDLDEVLKTRYNLQEALISKHSKNCDVLIAKYNRFKKAHVDIRSNNTA